MSVSPEVKLPTHLPVYGLLSEAIADAVLGGKGYRALHPTWPSDDYEGHIPESFLVTVQEEFSLDNRTYVRFISRDGNLFWACVRS